MTNTFDKKLVSGREYKTKETKEVEYEVTLHGCEKLHIKRIISTYEVTHELHPVTKNPTYLVRRVFKNESVVEKDLMLREVTVEILKALRKKAIPVFVLKQDGHYFATRLPQKISLSRFNLLGCHMCAQVGECCKHLSAASDEKGGCAKVRAKASRIEDYPWIKKGYETFGTYNDSMVVAECEHYSMEGPRKVIPGYEAKKAKLSLAQYVWPDVESLADVKAKKASIKAESRFVMSW